MPAQTDLSIALTHDQRYRSVRLGGSSRPCNIYAFRTKKDDIAARKSHHSRIAGNVSTEIPFS